MNRFKFLLFCVVCALHVAAQDYTAQQKSMISSISTNLTKQGYQCSVVKNGLKLLSENVSYYIEVSAEDQSMMFVSMCRYVEYGSLVRRESVNKAKSDADKAFGVKVQMMDKEVALCSEMYITKTEEFCDVLPVLLKQMKVAYKMITE